MVWPDSSNTGLPLLPPPLDATLTMVPCALTIGGSDSGGGAGIQADLKTFTVFRVFGTSAVTALTAQNTRGVLGIHPVPSAFVRAQIDAVAGDLRIDAAKTGMLGEAAVVSAVAAAVQTHRIAPLVIDPVMVAQSGTPLVPDDAIDALRRELLPLATLVTPNLYETQVLTGIVIETVADMRHAARALIDIGARACLVKGGHLPGPDACDVFDDGRDSRLLTCPRLHTPHTHGTGCQLAAAITANLALGLPLFAAIGRAKRFITVAIRHGLAIGHGAGPANPLAWLDED